MSDQIITKEDISIVVQGPVEEGTNETLNSFEGFSDIVLSTWEDEDLSLLKDVTVDYRLVTSKYQDCGDTFLDRFNKATGKPYCYWMYQTNYNGVANAKNKFSLKCRTDELYPDLSIFLDNFFKHPERIHTTNNGFWRHIPAMLSNHLFLGETEKLKNCFSNIKKFLSKQDFTEKKFDSLLFSEQIFAYFYMLENSFDILDDDWIDAFKKYVFITPMSDLPNHLHSGASDTSSQVKRVANFPNGRPDMEPVSKTMYNDINEMPWRYQL
jgi:hypothetical protein